MINDHGPVPCRQDVGTPTYISACQGGSNSTPGDASGRRWTLNWPRIARRRSDLWVGSPAVAGLASRSGCVQQRTCLLRFLTGGCHESRAMTGQGPGLHAPGSTGRTQTIKLTESAARSDVALVRVTHRSGRISRRTSSSCFAADPSAHPGCPVPSARHLHG